MAKMEEKIIGIREDFSSSSNSYDICFCNSDCENTKCSRCKQGKHFKSFLEYSKKWNGRHSVSNFAEKCSKYMEGKKNED